MKKVTNRIIIIFSILFLVLSQNSICAQAKKNNSKKATSTTNSNGRTVYLICYSTILWQEKDSYQSSYPFLKRNKVLALYSDIIPYNEKDYISSGMMGVALKNVYVSAFKKETKTTFESYLPKTPLNCEFSTYEKWVASESSVWFLEEFLTKEDAEKALKDRFFDIYEGDKQRNSVHENFEYIFPIKIDLPVYNKSLLTNWIKTHSKN